MSKTNIPWADYTLNAWEGCAKVSAGCAHCYAAERDKRHMIEPVDHWGKGAPRRLVKGAAENARKWNKRPWICDGCGKAFSLTDPAENSTSCPGCRRMGSLHRARVFLGSLMDIFDAEVSIDWFVGAMNIVRKCTELDFLLVTKRPENWLDRMLDARSALIRATPEAPGDFENWLIDWVAGVRIPRNVWIITSTENQEMLEKRVPDLLKIPAVVHGLSCEPLLGPLNFNIGGDQNWHFNCLTGKQGWLSTHTPMQWIIAGGESGPNAREMNIDWMRGIQAQCAAARVPYFAKQIGAKPCISGVSGLGSPDGDQYVHRFPIISKKGEDPNEWPEDMRVRQWPESQSR